MTSLVQSWDNVKGTASAAVTSAIGPGIESVRTVLDASDDQCPEWAYENFLVTGPIKAVEALLCLVPCAECPEVHKCLHESLPSKNRESTCKNMCVLVLVLACRGWAMCKTWIYKNGKRDPKSQTAKLANLKCVLRFAVSHLSHLIRAFRLRQKATFLTQASSLLA
eukprot:scaffold237371_cov21-Tisochrysis_lutea.AAC.1